MLLRRSLGELLRNDPLRMAGATAFFTTFALPAILVMLIQLLKLIWNGREARIELFSSLTKLVGPEAVAQVRSVLDGFRQLAQLYRYGVVSAVDSLSELRYGKELEFGASVSRKMSVLY